ncbi:MAG: YitT family protein [Oscillospiraceae bacterium]
MDILFDIAAAILYAVSVNMFTAPNQIAPGGVTGLATILNYLLGVPIGITTFLINVPLVILGLIFLGKAFTLKTLKTVVFFSLFVDLLNPVLQPYTRDHLLASLFGGILMGAALGLVFLRGSTTGGTDILGRLIQLPMPHVQIGKLIMLTDGLILLLSTIVYHNIETAMYGVIVIFLDGKVIDTILYGYDTGKQLMVISDSNEEIGRRVMGELERGATFFQARGAYSNEEKDVLMCIVKRNQFGKVKKIIKEIDPAAFVIVTEAGEVIGDGFKSIDKK